LTWFDQQEEERKKRQQIIQQMLNQTKSQKSYQPDYKGAAAFFGKYEAKQNPKTTTKPKAKTDTSKKTGLLDSLMKNASQFGNGIKNEFHSDINQFKNDLKDGFDLKDAVDLATMPLKYINPGGGNVLRGAVLGKNTHEDNFSADVGRNFTAGVGDVVKGVGDIMKWQGAKDPRTGVMDTWGKNLSDFGQKSLIDNYEKPYDKPFTWSSLLDPSFYSSSVARSLPFTLALLPASYLGAAAGAGAATAGLGAIAARGVTLGKAAQTIIKTAATAVGGSAVSVPFESAFEAANVYDDAIQKGASHEDADKMANDTFKGNLALLAGTQLPETALTFAHLGGFNPGLLGRTAMMAGSAGLEGVQEAGQEVISAHAKGQKADPTAMKESFAVGALMGLGSSIAGGELGKQDHGHLTPPVHPSDNPSPNDIPDPTSNQSYEEERQQAEKILGGADPKVVIRDAVRNRLPDELKSEVDFLRTSMEQQGLDQNEIEDHLDNYIADNPEGQKLFEEETQRLVERLKPEAAPTPTQADPAQNGIDEAVRQTQQAQVDPIQQADPQQAQPEQVQPQAEQQAPVQEQVHPLQTRYSEVMRQYNDLLNQRNPHMLSDNPDDKKTLNELSKQMKPLDKELTRLEKQMKKIGVSVPEGQVTAPQGQPVQEQAQQPMPTAQELNAMPIDERLKYQQAQQSVKQTVQEQKHPLYGQVVQHTLLTGNVSPSSIQEKFKIPYTQAVQLIDQMEANGIIESKPKEPLTQQPEQPVSTDAQGIKGMFDGIGQGIGEAAHQKTMEDVAKQGYTEFQKPESANLFRNNEQYKGWKEEKQSNGAIRFYPPAEQNQETKGSKTLEERRKEHEAKRQEQQAMKDQLDLEQLKTVIRTRKPEAVVGLIDQLRKQGQTEKADIYEQLLQEVQKERSGNAIDELHGQFNEMADVIKQSGDPGLNSVVEKARKNVDAIVEQAQQTSDLPTGTKVKVRGVNRASEVVGTEGERYILKGGNGKTFKAWKRDVTPLAEGETVTSIQTEEEPAPVEEPKKQSKKDIENNLRTFFNEADGGTVQEQSKEDIKKMWEQQLGGLSAKDGLDSIIGAPSEQSYTKQELDILREMAAEEAKPTKYDKAREKLNRLDRLAQKADQYLKDNKDRMNALPLDLYAAAAIVGANKIAHGVVDFAEWSEQMIKDYGPKLRLSLRSLYVQSEDIANFSDADLDEYLDSVGLTHLEDKAPVEQPKEQPKAEEPKKDDWKQKAENDKAAYLEKLKKMSDDDILNEAAWTLGHKFEGGNDILNFLLSEGRTKQAEKYYLDHNQNGGGGGPTSLVYDNKSGGKTEIKAKDGRSFTVSTKSLFQRYEKVWKEKKLPPTPVVKGTLDGKAINAIMQTSKSYAPGTPKVYEFAGSGTWMGVETTHLADGPMQPTDRYNFKFDEQQKTEEPKTEKPKVQSVNIVGWLEDISKGNFPEKHDEYIFQSNIVSLAFDALMKKSEFIASRGWLFNKKQDLDAFIAFTGADPRLLGEKEPVESMPTYSTWTDANKQKFVKDGIDKLYKKLGSTPQEQADALSSMMDHYQTDMEKWFSRYYTFKDGLDLSQSRQNRDYNQHKNTEVYDKLREHEKGNIAGMYAGSFSHYQDMQNYIADLSGKERPERKITKAEQEYEDYISGKKSEPLDQKERKDIERKITEVNARNKTEAQKLNEDEALDRAAILWSGFDDEQNAIRTALEQGNMKEAKSLFHKSFANSGHFGSVIGYVKEGKKGKIELADGRVFFTTETDLFNRLVRQWKTEAEDNQDNADNGVGEKPSNKSDEYQKYHNGDYVEWTKDGVTKTGYVSGHTWDSDKPGTLRPADTILILVEGQYNRNKGVRDHVRPDQTDITIIEKKPEHPDAEWFVKDMYRYRLDVDPKQLQERMKENGYETVPLGQILVWKNEVESAGRQKAKKDSETSRNKKVQDFVESYRGSTSKRQQIMNEFRKANPDHAKIRKELGMDAPKFTDFLVKEVENYRVEQNRKEWDKRKAEEAKNPNPPEEAPKPIFKENDLITFHSKKLNRVIKGYVLSDAPYSGKVDVIYTNGEKIADKHWDYARDDNGEPIPGSEWVDYENIIEPKVDLSKIKKDTRKTPSVSAPSSQDMSHDVFDEYGTYGDEGDIVPLEQEKTVNTPNTLGKNEALVTTQAGTEVQVKYEIVSMDDVIASHNVMGMINPKFPKELQPRDRSSADSEAQITEMARNLDPQRLGESRMASDGAPIIGPDGVVESGNGRTIAIMKMYSDMNRNGGYNPTEQKYNRFLKEFAKEHGLDVDVERMSRPVLVRVRQTDVNREKFVAEANESSVSSMGATETAQADAKKLKSLIHLFVPSESGDINTAANQEFIKKYINEVVPSSERREVRTKEGYLSKDGKERLERALFALAYNDNRVIAKYSEDLDDNARTVTGAMTDVAPKMAVLNGDIEAGSILPEFDLSKDVIEAFNQLVELRRKGEKIPQWIEEDKKQESLFADTKLSDAAYELLAQFDKLKSRNKIRAMLFNYVEYVMNDPRSQGEDLFGDRATKEEFLQIAIERMNGGGDLFELETKARPSETPQTGEKPGTKETSGHSQEQTKVINPLPEDPSKVDKKHFNQYVERMKTLINEFTSRIESGTMPTGNAVQGKIRDIAAGVLGRPAQEDEWRDALEVTIQQIYQTRVKDSMTLQEKIKIGQELEGYMKTSGRSIEQMDRQQFSTPIPLAEIVHSIAGVNSSDVVKEGSAGTGSLILPFKGEAKQIVPIELSPRRAAILKAIGFDVINDSTFNVTGIGYDKVVGNPPFKGQNKAGGTVELSGSAPWKGPWGDLGNRFLNWDLRGLKDGGRLTYIVSGGVIDNQQNREFRKWLKENHTVLAMVKFPSGVYDTRGTKFPTGLIVVEKGKVSGEQTPITGEFETLDSLLEALSPLTNTKIETTIPSEPVQETFQKGDRVQWKNSQGKKFIGDFVRYFPDGTPQVYSDHYKDEMVISNGTLERANNNDVVSDKGNGNTGTGNGNKNAEVRGGQSERNPAAGSQTSGEQSSGSGREGTGSTGTVHAPERSSGLDGGSDASPTVTQDEQEVISTTVQPEVEILDRGDARGNTRKNANPSTDSSQSSDSRYVPRRIVTNQAHPGNVTEAPNMRFVQLPDEIFEGDQYLPHEKVTKGGKWKLSDVQVETVMAAKYNFEMGKRGLLIADDTGMGKTAQQLGIAADAFYSGRSKRILIVTTKDQVATTNFRRDNENLGFELPMTWMHYDNKEYSKQHGKTWKDLNFHGKADSKTGKVPEPYKPFQIGDGVIIMSKTTFRDAQESIIKWLDGAEGDVTIIMDESHEFANREAGLGKANIRIFNQFKDKAQYIYASATAAEDIDGLEHMYGLHKWSTDGFGDFKLRLSSADTKAKSGKRKTGMSKSMGNNSSPFKREIPLTMMEQLTRELKMDGQYVGRSLSMEGVAMEGMPIKISPKEIGDWNRAVQFIGMIAQKAEMYGRNSEGEPDPKKRGMIISQVVGYMRRISGYYRMRGIIEDIQKQLADPNGFTRFGIIAEFVEGDDGKPANLFAAINTINDKQDVDTGSDVEIIDIPEAIEDKEYLLSILHGLNPEWGDEPVPNIPSPMQLLYDAFGEDNVAVIYGKVDPKHRAKIVSGFQEMKKKIIWFNSAGGTGVDMHDTQGTPIRVYTQDYAYNAKQQKQAEGRFHRTGQVTAPTFVYPYLNSSADTKFVGTLIARYEAMGALSRGDVGKLGGGELANFDMTGDAAEIAALRIIPELDADVRAEMFGEFTRDKSFIDEENGGLDETAASSVYSGNAPEVKRFLNALMFLDYETSSRVFDQFTEKIKQVEQELEEQGGVKDKFETYKGKELETQIGKNGIKLRKIKTILTDNQEKALAFDLKKAQENEKAMQDEYEKVKQEVLSKLEKQVEDIQEKQKSTDQELEEAKKKSREAEMKYRTGNLTIKELEKARNKVNALVGEYSRRDERLSDTRRKLKGMKDGNRDIIDTIPDMRRAQIRMDNARGGRLGAEANIERSKDILLVDGKIATNGLLVNIRQAIRKAAERVYGKTTPVSALTLELRGYTLENGERAIGAVVPKWAEADVTVALEGRMKVNMNTDDLQGLWDRVIAGHEVELAGGYGLKHLKQTDHIRVNGMTVAKDRELFKTLNKDGEDFGFNPVGRYFYVKNVEGMKRLMERFPIAQEKAEAPKTENITPPTPPGTRTAKGFKVEVNTDKHTTTGETIWVVKPIDSIPKEQWGAFAGHMKKYGGSYYGKFTKGDLRKFMGNFVFQKNPEPAFDKDPNPPLTDEELANRINRNIPSSETQGIVHPLFRPRTNASSDRPYVFSDPAIQERIDAAEEIPKEGFKSMLKTWLRTKKNQVVREYEHLPNTAEFSPLRHELLRLEKQRGVAMEDTARNLQALLTDLNRNQYELFRNLVLTADLMEENALGHALPFSFTEDSLKEQNALMQSYLANEPKVQDALDLRKRLWAKIKSDYVKAFKDIDQDVEQKFTKENYYRHLIVEKAKEKKVNAISGKKELKTPKGQGYMKHRKGSEKDFVTDYLLAESEVMANMLFDIQVAKSVKLVDDRYNIEKQLKKEIELENNRSLLEYVKLAKKEWARTDELQAEGRDEGEIDAILKREGVALPERVKDVLAQYQANYKLRLGGQHDNLIEATMKAMKNNVGRAYGDLKKLAQNGDLWAGKDDEYQDVVDDLAAGRDNTDKNRWFDYLSELGSTSEEGVIAALTYLKNVRGQRLFQQDLIGQADFKTIQNSIPPGYDIWQPDKGNVFYMQNTLPEQVAMNLFNGFLDEITEKNFTKMLVMGGKKKGFIVKDEVKTTLENLMPISKYSDWLALSRQIKQLLLLSPTGVFKYNARNMTGDLDKVVSGNPDSLRYFATAANDLGRVFFKKGAPPKEMNEWMRRGGIQTLLQSQEFGDMKNLSIFRDKIREKEMATYAKVLNLPVKVWKGFWNATRTVTDYREAILRYASFLSYLKQIEKSGGKPKNYGASLREEINALPDKYDKAFTLSNDLLIAYDKTSVMGKKLRDTLIPFVSFTEGNIRSYIRVFKNAYHDEELANAVGRKLLSGVLIKSPKIAFNVGRMAMKVTFLTVLTALFNNLFWPDEEKELPADVRNTVHIILGRDDKGQVLYFNRLGTLQDFLGWFGLDDVQGDVASYLNGEKTLPQLLGADVIQSANKLVQSLHPIGKTIGEEIAGLKFFPDFTHPTQIQDRIQHIMGLFTFDTEYASIRDAVMGRPHKRYKTENLVAYSAEPEETNYYNVKDKAQAAAEKYLGKEKSLYLGKKSETSQYLYEIKQGLHYGDMEYAQTYLNKYIAAGGTDRGLKTSLKSMNPLDVIPTDLRQSYYNSLSDEDKANVDRAYKYYQKVLLNGVKLD
jgi:hypothetical protein